MNPATMIREIVELLGPPVEPEPAPLDPREREELARRIADVEARVEALEAEASVRQRRPWGRRGGGDGPA